MTDRTPPADADGDGPAADAPLPVVNSHVHAPPNFSAFRRPADVIAAAQAQGVKAIGFSNFFDQRVYAQLGEAARAAGVVALYGLEFIAVVPELAASGVRVNDPANPGRMYVCGKGVDPARQTPRMAELAAAVRAGNDARAAAMAERVAAELAAAGFDAGLTADVIAARTAERAGVPVEWVSLQERHIAEAVQTALAALPSDRRAAVLAAVYGRPSAV
ncbi:MAG: hypothetical protein LBH76_00900, partial [Propionibacteriaceae bacterium]|nr:hypothetical protein [Propionibacteriaceae bacterium]